MNFNLTQFLIQTAAMTAWVFLVAATYAILERVFPAMRTTPDD